MYLSALVRFNVVLNLNGASIKPQLHAVLVRCTARVLVDRRAQFWLANVFCTRVFQEDTYNFYVNQWVIPVVLGVVAIPWGAVSKAYASPCFVPMYERCDEDALSCEVFLCVAQDELKPFSCPITVGSGVRSSVVFRLVCFVTPVRERFAAGDVGAPGIRFYRDASYGGEDACSAASVLVRSIEICVVMRVRDHAWAIVRRARVGAGVGFVNVVPVHVEVEDHSQLSAHLRSAAIEARSVSSAEVR